MPRCLLNKLLNACFAATTITTETMSALFLRPKGFTSHGPDSPGVEKLVRLFHIGYRTCRLCCNSMDLAFPSYSISTSPSANRGGIMTWFPGHLSSLDATFTLSDRDANGSERPNSLSHSSRINFRTLLLLTTQLKEIQRKRLSIELPLSVFDNAVSRLNNIETIREFDSLVKGKGTTHILRGEA